MYCKEVIEFNRGKLEETLGFELREYSFDEVEEFRARLRGVEWDPENTASTIQTLPDDIQRYIFNEIQMSKINFEYWVNRYANVISDKGIAIPIKLWASQRAFLNKVAEMEKKKWDPSRPMEIKIPIILLKSRQVGGTVISEALLNHMTIFNPNTRSILGSDHPDNTLKLYRVFTTILDKLPPWMKPRVDARVKGNNLHFTDLESDVVMGSGNQKTTLGQGMTVDAAHLTEVSTWLPENADAIDQDLRPAFFSSRKHHSFLLIESTGAGAKGNWFHDQFQAAKLGLSQFESVFVGWFMCPDKSSRSANGLTFSEETLNMALRVRRESGVELTREQMAWWQTEKQDYEIRGKLEDFLQEYPSTPQEAFQTGMKSVFSLDLRMKLRDKVRQPIAIYSVDPKRKKMSPFYPDGPLSTMDADGKLLIWELSKPGFLYTVAVDASYGNDGGDSSAIEVVRIGNRWAPDEQVAEWRGLISPVDLANVAEMVGRIYTDKVEGLPAMLAIEVNPGSPGLTTQTELIRKGYPNFYMWRKPLTYGGGWTKEIGWHTTSGTRNLLVDRGISGVKSNDLVINSPFLIEEMDTFVTIYGAGGNRKVEHADGYHDDRIMALFIAYITSHGDGMDTLAEERRALFDSTAEKPKIIEFQSLGLSMDEAMERWENELML